MMAIVGEKDYGGRISKIKVQPGAVAAVEGSLVTLSCKYSGSSPDLFWFIQSSGRPPVFVLRTDRYTTGTDQQAFGGRFQSHDSSTELTITGLTLADTALYYCALDTQ
uniref:Ig-like domain-containing protein n=1 Tax=Myripristis murdjan TaxID=586833 RepID=A0A667WQS9_9TELE